MLLQLQEQQRIEAERKRLQAATNKAANIIQNISHYKNADWANFDWIVQEIGQMDELESTVLNERLNIANKPAIYTWIKDAKKDGHFFLSFILQCKNIALPVNKTPEGSTSTLQVLYQNPLIQNKSWIAQLLFLRGYNLSPGDREQLTSALSEDDRRLFDIYNNLSDRSLVPFVSRHISLINIIETAKQGKMVGYHYKSHEWAAFAINAIQYYALA